MKTTNLTTLAVSALAASCIGQTPYAVPRFGGGKRGHAVELAVREFRVDLDCEAA